MFSSSVLKMLSAGRTLSAEDKLTPIEMLEVRFGSPNSDFNSNFVAPASVLSATAPSLSTG